MGNLPYGERSAKHILFHLFKACVEYKKSEVGQQLAPQNQFNQGKWLVMRVV